MVKGIRDVVKALASNSRSRVRALNIEWVPMDSGGIVVDFGWAVLAKRTPKTITIYNGWRGYSPTTTKHISQIYPYGGVKGCRVIRSNKAPKVSYGGVVNPPASMRRRRGR